MNVFAILPPEANSVLDKRIEEVFPGNCLKISPNQWLIAGKGTSREVSDHLQITETNSLGAVSKGLTGVAVVLAVTSYFGTAPTNVWEWLKTKLEAPQP